MIAITTVGGAIGLDLVVLAVVGVLLVRRRRADALFVAVAVGGAQLLNALAKLAFHRTRPELWKSPAPALGYSFPSGHAMASMAFCGALVVVAWRTRWRWYALAFALVFVPLVGASRVYLGVHYPSDSLAGWCASLLWVAGLALLHGRLRSRARRRAGAPAHA
jgi:undecaprenyl-diphosphatase